MQSENEAKKKRRSPNQEAKNLAKRFVQTLDPEKGTRIKAVIGAWPSVVGPKLAQMTEALEFKDGTLKVLVKNSTLYTLFVQYEKSRLLQRMKCDFPQVKNIVFKMG